MNQILTSEKIYVTNKLKRKKRFYKIQFILSVCIVIVLSSYYVYSEYDKRKNEAISQEILEDISFGEVDTTIVQNDTLVVALDDTVETVVSEQEQEQQIQVLDKFNTTYTTNKGTKYKVDSILNIPSIQITYPVLSETSDELLKISINKFWGGEPNSVGNYCIVGHNYDGKDIFFGKLNQVENGDIVELQDKTGEILKYKVYDMFIVQPTDVACTSQLTNGKKEMTLITCSDGGKTRLIVKCRAEF